MQPHLSPEDGVVLAGLPVGVLLIRLSARDSKEELSSWRICLKVLTEPSYRAKTTRKCLCKKVFISEPTVNACVHLP